MTQSKIGRAANYICEIDTKVPHKLLDMSIENVTERAQRAKIYPTAQDAANFLGCSLETIFRNRTPQPPEKGKKYVTGIDGKKYAVRLVK